jgi:1,3-beta-galactosyl-N-acetylhexosamine phosphorylase
MGGKKMRNLRKGRFTLPAEAGMNEQVMELIDKWGADAIRNSDGTKLPKELMNLAIKVYTTYLTVRNDQEWVYSHRDQLQMQYLMSKHNIATSDIMEINIMDGYFKRQFEVDINHDIKRYWEVYDRTTGEVVDVNSWSYNEETQKVIIQDAKKWHRYTVSFLAYQVWDTTQMYNHLTNNWTTPPEMPYDIFLSFYNCN